MLFRWQFLEAGEERLQVPDVMLVAVPAPALAAPVIRVVGTAAATGVMVAFRQPAAHADTVYQCRFG